jgi:hypothetical protein
METIRTYLLASVCAAFLLTGTSVAQESGRRQQEKLPSKGKEKRVTQAPFPGDDMPSYKADLKADRMPMPKMWAMQTDPKTGQILSYTDPQKGLRYDFEKKEIRDLRTGKVYIFAEKHPSRQPDTQPLEEKPRHEKKPLLL